LEGRHVALTRDAVWKQRGLLSTPRLETESAVDRGDVPCRTGRAWRRPAHIRNANWFTRNAAGAW